MDTNIILASLGLVLGLMTFFFGVMMWMMSKLDNDIRQSNAKSDISNAKFEAKSDISNAKFEAKFDIFNQRIDQLYGMFCDMQSEIKDLYKERK